MSFSSFGFPEEILQGVYASGYSSPTEIQLKAIPLANEGRDILGCAPTGTGKTAAFVLPILNRLWRDSREQQRSRAPRALILTPTRELAQQIEQSVLDYVGATRIKALAVYGGVGINNQISELRRGVDIVIATPGRLLDLLDRRSINLGHVAILVLDEADRMYDMGFIRDVRSIISRVPRQRQTLLFSATMPVEIRKLVGEIQQKPVVVEVSHSAKTSDLVDQHFFEAPQHVKSDLLLRVLRDHRFETMLVFSRTKHGADRISKRLQREGIAAAAIHADRTQSQRRHALEGFKRRQFRVLVATDLAARGIDVDRIACVVNYDTPAFAEDYVHRIGRTGRAEAQGTAMTFVSEDERKHLVRIEHLTGRAPMLRKYPEFDTSRANPNATRSDRSRRDGRGNRINQYQGNSTR